MLYSPCSSRFLEGFHFGTSTDEWVLLCAADALEPNWQGISILINFPCHCADTNSFSRLFWMRGHCLFDRGIRTVPPRPPWRIASTCLSCRSSRFQMLRRSLHPHWVSPALLQFGGHAWSFYEGKKHLLSCREKWVSFSFPLFLSWWNFGVFLVPRRVSFLLGWVMFCWRN